MAVPPVYPSSSSIWHPQKKTRHIYLFLVLRACSRVAQRSDSAEIVFVASNAESPCTSSSRDIGVAAQPWNCCVSTTCSARLRYVLDIKNLLSKIYWTSISVLSRLGTLRRCSSLDESCCICCEGANQGGVNCCRGWYPIGGTLVR